MQSVLVMGLGRGLRLAQAAQRSPGLQLAGVIDPAVERLQKTAGICGLPPQQLFQSLDDALAATRSDILVVATPTPLHAQHVLQGLSAGLHVLCEKPLAIEREKALRMRQGARDANRQLAVIQNSRYGAHFRKCRQLLAEGLIGPLHWVECRFRRWRGRTPTHPHAVLFNHGVHHIDIIRSVTGAEPSRIDATEWDPKGQEGKGLCLRLTAQTEAGYTVSYDASYAEAGSQSPQSGELRLAGASGTLEASGEFEDPQLWLSRNAKVHGEDLRERIPVQPIGWDEIDLQLLEDFARAIESGQPAETSVDDNLQTLEWLFRAAEAIDRKD